MQVYIEISKCIFRFKEIFAYDIKKTKKKQKAEISCSQSWGCSTLG